MEQFRFFLSAPNYGTVSYDSIHNHSTAGTGSVKLSSDTSDIARMWIDLATVDSLLTIQYLGSAEGQVIGIGVGNITDNEYKFTGYIDSYVSSAELSTWREYSYDWYSKIEQYISSDPDWGWSDDFAVVVATDDSSLYIDKYELGCPQTDAPNISGASSRTVNYMMMPYQETFTVPAGADGYQWSCSTGTIVSGGTSNSCTFSFLHYSSQTHVIKCEIQDTDYCTQWSEDDTHNFTINLW